MAVILYTGDALPTSSSPVWGVHRYTTPKTNQSVSSGILYDSKALNLVEAMFIYYDMDIATIVQATGATMVGRYKYVEPIEDISAGLRLYDGGNQVWVKSKGQTRIRVTDDGSPSDYDVSVGTDYFRQRLTIKVTAPNCTTCVYINDVLVHTKTFVDTGLLATPFMAFGLFQGLLNAVEMYTDYIALDDSGAYTPSQKSDYQITGIPTTTVKARTHNYIGRRPAFGGNIIGGG